jgi:ligand-binding SRPBCC domain-containing protein
VPEIFEKRTRIPAPARQVFAWHEGPDALRSLIPPRDPVRVVRQSGGVRDGAEVVLALGFGPLSIYWVACHKNYLAGRQFTDVQKKGPFHFWEHTHTILPDGPDACILIDHVEYELPFGFLGRFALPLVRRKLKEMFAWRHQVTFEANTAS